MQISNIDLTYFKVSPRSKVLDIGVGNGERCLNFAHQGFLTYALDSSKVIVTKVKNQIKQVIGYQFELYMGGPKIYHFLIIFLPAF